MAHGRFEGESVEFEFAFLHMGVAHDQGVRTDGCHGKIAEGISNMECVKLPAVVLENRNDC
jgi:hypothetical protein